MRIRLCALVSAGAIATACFSEHEPELDEAAITCARAELPAGPDSAIVVIRGFRYEPAELAVPPGTRIVWINCEPAGTPGHTTTADDGTWDSPTLVPGEVFSAVLSLAGTYDYHCRPHPGIRGSVLVADGAAAQRAARLAVR